MLNGGSMVWGFCVYFVYMIPLETDVLRKHRFQKPFTGEFLPIKSIRSIEIGSLTWISFVADIKQTCLGQGLGVTITARKRPSKLMHAHHEGLRSYAAWSSKLSIDDITLNKQIQRIYVPAIIVYYLNEKK